MKMSRTKLTKYAERGATLVEFSIAAAVFMASMFAVIEFGRLLWVHNALSDAARRGARYAAVHSADDVANVKNVVVYGNADGSGQPLVNNLTTTNVQVNYSSFNVNKGTVTVSITNYQFQFVVPLIGTTIDMPAYTTTLTGESVGLIPASL
jgi:Flp pilus assembly protein TadG